MESPASPAVPSLAWQRRQLWLVIAVVVFVRLLFMVTFPLNDRGGDTFNYLSMLLDGTSNLMHASGYPFLVGVPFRTAPVQRLFAAFPGALPIALLVVQHGIDLLSLFFLYRVTAAVFGPLTGALALLLSGTSLQALGVTSSTYPEWLQAACLILYLGTTYYAYAERPFGTKMSLYAAAALAFALCVLVKFNAAILGVVLLLAVAADALSFGRKAGVLVACSIVSAGTGGAYVLFHHQPQTGTYALTYDRAWVLLTRIQIAFDNRLEPDAGPATRRWLALSGVLPRSYEVAGPGMFARVDAVPAAIRAPYRARYAYLLTAGPVAVAQVHASAPLPEGFSVGLSPIPVGYYIGLAESDDLGTRVAVEAVRAHPREFAAVVRREVLAALRSWPDGAPYPARITQLAAFGAVPRESWSLGFVRVSQRPDPTNVPFSYSQPVLWWPGVRLFSALHDQRLPGYAPAVILSAAAVIALLRIVRSRRVDLQSGTALLLTAIVIMVVAASVTTLSFRWKEARLLAPLVSVLAAWVTANGLTAVVWCSARAGSLLGRRQHPHIRV